MPEWLWSIIVGVIVVGLLAALRSVDRERIAALEQWTRDKEKTDRDWRHDEYQQRMSEVIIDVATLKTKVDRIERERGGN